MKKYYWLMISLIVVMSLFMAASVGADGSGAGFNVDCRGAFGYGDVPAGARYDWEVRFFDPPHSIDQIWQGGINGSAPFNAQVLWPATPSTGTSLNDSYFWADIWNYGTGEHVFHAEGHFDCTPPPTPTPTTPPHTGGQGCTPGYWKQSQHFDSWVGYNTTDLYSVVFGVNAGFGNNTTLLGALGQGGGGEKALGRHATAALLNAANPNVSYLYSEAQIIAMVQSAYASGDFEGVKDLLAAQNEIGCPLN